MKEAWKDVPGYEGLYQVSNLGRVKSLSRKKNGAPSKLSRLQVKEIKEIWENGRQKNKTEIGRRFGITRQAVLYVLRHERNRNYIAYKTKEKILSPATDSYGYLVVGITRKGELKGRKVHRLVAQAFVPNPQNKPEINHKDGDKKNNLPSNLEWVTQWENQVHATQTGLRPTGNQRKLDPKKVALIWKRLYAGEVQRTIAEDCGVSQATIALIKRGRIWKGVKP